MMVRFRGERRGRAAHLERGWKLRIAGADPLRPEEDAGAAEVELVSATRGEREALRRAGFALSANRQRRAA